MKGGMNMRDMRDESISIQKYYTLCEINIFFVNDYYYFSNILLHVIYIYKILLDIEFVHLLLYHTVFYNFIKKINFFFIMFFHCM